VGVVVVVNNLDVVLLANLVVGGIVAVVDGDDDDPIASAIGVVVDVAITTIANIAKSAKDVNISICVTIN
jgi:diacylglycerol kinase